MGISYLVPTTSISQKNNNTVIKHTLLTKNFNTDSAKFLDNIENIELIKQDNLGLNTPYVEIELPKDIQAEYNSKQQISLTNHKSKLSTVEYGDIESEIKTSLFHFKPEQDEKIAQVIIIPDFWKTLHSIESKQGKILYRPRNKQKNCNSTSAPCGHHQLSKTALKDISCLSKQCMLDRENYEKSLAMSKQLLELNKKRLLKAGYVDLPEYQNYLVHQQGATGFKIILASSQGTKLLSKTIKKNMASNSPFSYKTLRKMGSKLAATKFLLHWKSKWLNEKKLIVSYKDKQENAKTIFENNLTADVPLFNDYELQIALNIKM